MDSTEFLSLAYTITAILLSFSLALTLYRLIKGPSIPDRVVAIELITNISMGMVALFFIRAEQPVFLDAIGVVALVSFLGGVAYAKALEKEANHD